MINLILEISIRTMQERYISSDNEQQPPFSDCKNYRTFTQETDPGSAFVLQKTIIK